MKHYAIQTALFLLFACTLYFLYLNLIELRTPKENTQINDIMAKIDSIETQTIHYETKITNNRTFYNRVADSIIYIPDSQLNSAIFATLDRFAYLNIQAEKNDSTNGK